MLFHVISFVLQKTWSSHIAGFRSFRRSQDEFLFFSRAVTRGINKGVKEDFRAALERQICRSDDSFEPFLKAFFQDEKESLLS